MNKDYYDILGLDSTATPKEIKKAYMQKARVLHPDKHPHATDEERDALSAEFKEVEEAYRVLKDPINRAHYDQTGEGKMPQSKEMATQKIIHLFQKNIKKALEKEMAMDAMSSQSWGTFASQVTSGMEKILETCRHELKTEKEELKQGISALEKGVTKLNKYKRKVRSKGESNLYAQVIEQQLVATQGALAAAGIEQIAIETALEHLKDYEYVMEDNAENLIGGVVKTEGIA